MRTVIVIHKQNIWDIAVQEYGTIEGVFDLIQTNGLAISDELTPGQVLSVPDSKQASADVADYYQAKELHPATGIEKNLIVGGIGYMQIETDFIVS